MDAAFNSVLNALFDALQIIDPTNYIPPGAGAATQPHAEPANPAAEEEADVSDDTPNTAEQTHECPICLESAPAANWRIPGPCLHGACEACLRAQVSHAARARRAPVPCATCSDPLDGAATLAFVTGDEAERLSDALAVAAAGHLRYCHACGEAVASTQDFRCPSCDEHTCTRCGAQAHPGTQCNMEFAALTDLAMTQGWTRCPGCRALVSKDSSWSCNYAVCVCSTAFCIRCGVPYRRGLGEQGRNRAGNQHGTPGCQCGLYER